MEIVLHVGPHKTGTTSLQVALQRAFGTPRPGAIWYPPTEPPGPGHALLAWRLLGIGHISADPRPMEDLLRRAREGGCERLLLSAEDFSQAGTGDRMPLLVQIGAHAEVLPVVTLCPIGRRSVSLWQQFVKSGHDLPLEESWPQIGGMLYEHKLVEGLVAGFPTSRLRIIIVDRYADPRKLFDDFSAATGIPLDAESKDHRVVLNPSADFVETELVRSVTRALLSLDIAKENHQGIRDGVIRLFHEYSLHGRQLAPRVPILIPPTWREEVERRTTALLELLGRLQGERRVRIFGDIELLKDTGPWRADTEPAQTVAPHRLQLLLGAMLALAMENGQKANKELVASKERERQANEALVIAAGGVQQAEKMLTTATERERQASETLRNIQASRFWRASRPVLRMINRFRQVRNRLLG